MAAMKLPLLAFVVLVFLSVSQAHSNIAADVRQMFSPTQPNNCLCFQNNNNYKTVPEILYKHDQHLQRLVIYLYKNHLTDDIQIYMPRKDMQALLPDLPFLHGDSLVPVSHYDIKEIFKRNPNVVTIQNWPQTTKMQMPEDYVNAPTNHNDIDAVTAEDITEVSGAFVDKPLQNPIQNPVQDLVQDPVQNHVQYLVQNLLQNPDEVVQNTDDEEILSSGKQNVPVNSDDQNEMSQEIENDDKNTISQEQQSQENYTPTSSEFASESAKIIDWLTDDSQKLYPSPIVENNSNEELNVPQPLLTDSYETPLNIDSTYNVKEHVHGNIPNNIIPCLNPLLCYQNHEPGQTSSLSNSNWDNNILIPDNSNVKYLPYVDYTTFDDWFRAEMKSFQEQKLKNFDVITVGYLLLKILEENDMYVTQGGFVTDKNGEILDMQNLNLQLILIGDAVTVSTLIDPRNQNKHVPYLQLVLVTKVHPFKILGTIPLGRTLLPTNAAATMSSVTRLLRPRVLNHIPTYKSSDMPEVRQDGNDDPGDDNDYNISSKSKREAEHSSICSSDGAAHHLDNERNNQVEEFLRSMPHNTRRDNVVINNNNQIPSGHGEKPHFLLGGLHLDLGLRRSQNEESVDDDVDDTADSEEESMNRIIGGNAATSSGTPLSFKGK